MCIEGGHQQSRLYAIVLLVVPPQAVPALILHDIDSLPDDIDLSVITISAAAAVNAVRMCAEKASPTILLWPAGLAKWGKRAENSKRN